MQNFRLTAPVQFVLHSCISILLGGIASALVTVGEASFTGKTDMASVLLAGLSAFSIYFTTHLSSLWNNPQTVQAALDLANEAKAGYSQLAASHHTLAATVNALVQANASQPVQVHVTTPPQAPATPAQAPIEAQPTQSVPAVSAQAAPIAPPFSLPTFSSAMPAVPRQ